MLIHTKLIWFVYYSGYHDNQQHIQHATTEPAPSPTCSEALRFVLTQAINDDTGRLVWNNKSPAYKSTPARRFAPRLAKVVNGARRQRSTITRIVTQRERESQE